MQDRKILTDGTASALERLHINSMSSRDYSSNFIICPEELLSTMLQGPAPDFSVWNLPTRSLYVCATTQVI